MIGSDKIPINFSVTSLESLVDTGRSGSLFNLSTFIGNKPGN